VLPQVQGKRAVGGGTVRPRAPLGVSHAAVVAANTAERLAGGAAERGGTLARETVRDRSASRPSAETPSGSAFALAPISFPTHLLARAPPTPAARAARLPGAGPPPRPDRAVHGGGTAAAVPMAAGAKTVTAGRMATTGGGVFTAAPAAAWEGKLVSYHVVGGDLNALAKVFTLCNVLCHTATCAGCKAWTVDDYHSAGSFHVAVSVKRRRQRDQQLQEGAAGMEKAMGKRNHTVSDAQRRGVCLSLIVTPTTWDAYTKNVSLNTVWIMQYALEARGGRRASSPSVKCPRGHSSACSTMTGTQSGCCARTSRRARRPKGSPGATARSRTSTRGSARSASLRMRSSSGASRRGARRPVSLLTSRPSSSPTMKS